MKIVKAPDDFYKGPSQRRYLKLDGATLVESCTREIPVEKELFLKEHVFAFMISGKYLPEINGQKMEVLPGECILLRKINRVKYTKFADTSNHKFECVFFFIKDTFLRELLQMNSAISINPVRGGDMIKVRTNELLNGYIQSVRPYFDAKFEIQEGLLRLKMLELILGLANSNEQLIGQLMDFSQPDKNDLQKVMEQHFTKNLPLKEFAYLSGRSLSAFKRDFQDSFHCTPGKWLLNKRLDHARILLEQTNQIISDICYEAGFENLSHFSRSFKDHFGIEPSRVKQFNARKAG